MALTTSSHLPSLTPKKALRADRANSDNNITANTCVATPDHLLRAINAHSSRMLTELFQEFAQVQRMMLFNKVNQGLNCKDTIIEATLTSSVNITQPGIKTLMAGVYNQTGHTNESFELNVMGARTPHLLETLWGERVFTHNTEEEHQEWLATLIEYIMLHQASKPYTRSLRLAFSKDAISNLSQKNVAIFDAMITLVGMKELL